MPTHGVVLGLAEEGLDVPVVGLQDGVEVLQWVLTRAVLKAIDLQSLKKFRLYLIFFGYSDLTKTGVNNTNLFQFTFCPAT